MGRPRTRLATLAILALLSVLPIALRRARAQVAGPADREPPAAAAEGRAAGEQGAGTRSEGAATQPRRRLRVPDAGQLVADAIVPVDHGRRLHALVPTTTYVELACGHLDMPGDRPVDAYREQIRRFLADAGVLPTSSSEPGP